MANVLPVLTTVTTILYLYLGLVPLKFPFAKLSSFNFSFQGLFSITVLLVLWTPNQFFPS